MKRFVSYIIGVAVTLTLFDYAGAELAFRSNSKISLPDSTPAAIVSKPPIPIYQSTSKNSINSTFKGIQLQPQQICRGINHSATRLGKAKAVQKLTGVDAENEC